MVIYLEQKKIHFDLRFILIYNINMLFPLHENHIHVAPTRISFLMNVVRN